MGLIGDGGLWAVAGIDLRVGWEFAEHHRERMDDLFVGTAFEVGTSDAHTEEGVATEGDAFFFAIISDAAWRVARGVEYLQGVVAEGDGVFVGEVSAYGRYFHRQVDTEDVGSLLHHVLHQKLVADMRLGLQTELTVDEAVTHAVVEVAVGAEQVDGLQAVVPDILDDGGAFIVVHHTTVDDDGLVGVVAHHIAVLGEHITGETLNGNHIGR